MKQFNSLGVKLLLAYLAGMVLSIGLLVCAAVGVLKGSVLARMDLADAAGDMAQRIEFDHTEQPVGIKIDDDDDGDFAWVFDSLGREAAYRVLDDAGRVVLLSPPGEGFWPAAQVLERLAPSSYDFEREGVTMHGVTERVVRGGKHWYFQIAASSRLMHLLHRVALPLVVMGILAFSAVLLAAFGLCAFITLRYTLRPLREVSDSAAAISPRSLHARLATGSVPREIGPLVESFNRVLERVEQGYRVQQEFLANAAHELKTPLALIRAQIELQPPSADGSRDALLRDVAYMARQVQQLLLLAEASEAHNYQMGDTRADEVAHEAAAYLQRRAEAAGVHLAVAAPEDGVRWMADRGALFTLLKNLLENAIEHAPAGSTVDVEVAAHSLTVRDHGPGVAADQLPLLFARFWRGPHRRDLGAGLGLAICQEIALAHGWQLTAEPAGPGLRLSLALQPASS